jgi:CHAT domain-containing protein
MSAEAAGDPLTQVMDLHARARMALRRDDAAGAAQLCQEAIRRYDDVVGGDPTQICNTYLILGQALTRLDRMPDALEAFDRVCDLTRGHPVEAADCLSERALFLMQAGHAFATIAAIEEVLARPSIADLDPELLGILHDHLAGALCDIGEPIRAMAEYQKGAKLLRSAEPRHRVINLLAHATAAQQAASAEVAKTSFRSALSVAREAARMSSKEEKRFRKCCHRAVQTRFSDKNVEALYFTFVSFGGLPFGIHGPLTQLSDIRDQATAKGDPWVALLAYVKATEWLINEGDQEEALRVAHDGLLRARLEGLAPFAGWFASELALMRRQAEHNVNEDDGLLHLAEAEYFFDLHRRHQSALGSKLTETLGMQASIMITPSPTLNELANRAKSYGDHETARELYADARQLGEQLLATPSVLPETNALLNLLALRDQDPSDPALAQDIEDSAAHLRDALARADVPPEDRVAAAIALHHAQSWARVEDEITALRALVELTGRSPSRARFNNRQGAVLRELSGKLMSTGRHAAAWTTLQQLRARSLLILREGSSTPPSLDRAVELLTAAARPAHDPPVLVDIVEKPDGLAAFLVGLEGDVELLDVPGDLGPLINTRKGDLPSQADKYLRLARKDPLLTRLIAEIHSRTTERDLLLSVDDGLANLPWAAAHVDGRPWAESQLIGRIPAVAVLGLETSTWSGRSLVAGDSRGDLPGARRECERVADLLGTTQPLIGPDCTQTALGSVDEQLDFLHLAVHGFADSRRGGRATLVLARPDGGAAWVPFEELARLPWRARVVVFSGCSTAVGGPRTGEGLYGLAQTAMTHGADSVVASLWPVNDAAAAAFMTAFHADVQAQLAGGYADLRLAHRQAARDFARQPDFPLATGPAPSRGNRELFVRPRPGQVAPVPRHEHAVGEAFVVMGNPILRS